MYQQTILLVEDSDDIRLMLKLALEMKGYRVIEATNGKQAVEYALQKSPELILMDLTMPVMDGWEATRRLRQYDRLRDVPIVAVSAHASDHLGEVAIKSGCNACIPKPVDDHVLDRVLSEYLTVH